MRKFHSLGAGAIDKRLLGENVVIEEGVRIWHPENLFIGHNVYIGHQTLLNAYFSGQILIGNDTWIGPNVYIHGAGKVSIGKKVGIGPFVKIFSSSHELQPPPNVILEAPLTFAPVTIEDEVDIGVGSIILPGVTIAKGSQVGAGSVLTKSTTAYSVNAGNPARQLRMR